MKKLTKKYFIFSVNEKTEKQCQPMITSINSSEIGGGIIIPGQISAFLAAKTPAVPTGILIIGDEKLFGKLTASLIQKFPEVQISFLDSSKGLSKKNIITQLRETMPKEERIVQLIKEKIVRHDFQLFGGGIHVSDMGKKVSTGAHKIYQAISVYEKDRDFETFKKTVEGAVSQKTKSGLGFFNYRYDNTANLYKDILNSFQELSPSTVSSPGPSR